MATAERAGEESFPHHWGQLPPGQVPGKHDLSPEYYFFIMPFDFTALKIQLPIEIFPKPLIHDRYPSFGNHLNVER
ncbi:hypothetical protein DUI87_14790 [Hirundo rustica rustica]|uniref:Uncharacterized protein n=1 Tax=Hirundo rustica rustica TaxID=333673 RepID=A0A3M0K5U0_HIRRU|nr:hypothetical protein DUI87_14790 [Hirundo rustica rustica]